MSAANACAVMNVAHLTAGGSFYNPGGILSHVSRSDCVTAALHNANCAMRDPESVVQI